MRRRMMMNMGGGDLVDDCIYFEVINKGKDVYQKVKVSIPMYDKRDDESKRKPVASVYYSLDRVSWIKVVAGTEYTFYNRIYFRADNLVWTYDGTSYGYFRFTLLDDDVKVRLGGNLDGSIGHSEHGYFFYKTFSYNKSLVDASKLIITMPKIRKQYELMNMFCSCTSLMYPPKMEGYIPLSDGMRNMFYNCSSLLFGPEAIDSNDVSNACAGMFWGCTSLTRSPILNSLSVTNFAVYDRMFYGCSNLNHVEAWFKNYTEDETLPGLYQWLEGVASTGVFVKNIDATWKNTAPTDSTALNPTTIIPSGWTVIYRDVNTGRYWKDTSKTEECDSDGNPL